ncbi:MAG: V-type ATPase subunit [Clostridia bacterium]|nr:V-type ATPase subunit [Clostridia bacterium]
MEQIYPYAVSKIKAKEINMLTNQNFNQLVEEKSLERIVSIITGKGYNFENITRIENFEFVLENEQQMLYKLIKELIEDEKFIKIFLSKNDYNNIKLILKSKIQNKKYIENLNQGGFIIQENLIKIMESENYDLLDKKMKEAIIEAKLQYEITKNPYVIDCILDKASFEEMKQISLIINNEFIIKYVQNLIDITNIKTFFRIKKIYKNDKVLEIAYIPGGSISLNELKKNLTEDIQNLQGKFGKYNELIEKAINSYDNLDVYCDNYIMEYMKESKLKALTIEPIIAYIYAKETEIRNIRVIFTGKLNNINTEKIKERLREAYV